MQKGGKDEEDERVSEKSGEEAVGIRVSNGGQCHPFINRYSRNLSINISSIFLLESITARI